MKPAASHGTYIKYKFSGFKAVSVTARLSLACMAGCFPEWATKGGVVDLLLRTVTMHSNLALLLLWEKALQIREQKKIYKPRSSHPLLLRKKPRGKEEALLLPL